MALRCRELLDRLVCFQSVAGRPNGAIAGFLERRLLAAGARVERSEYGGGDHINLWATVGPADVPGVVLSAHMDVVSVDGQAWSGDPFTLRERGGRLVGRGVADMKGFLAAAVTAVEAAAAQPLVRPLHLAVTTDEEIGCVGVRELAPFLSSLGARPVGAIVGEPTGMRLVTAHKGKLAGRIETHGRAVHSALAPLGQNAVEDAAALIVELRHRATRLIEPEPADARYEVPHSTLSVGPIRGGTALNVVPDHCTFEIEVRHLPGRDPGVFFEGVSGWHELARYPGLETAPESPIARLVRACGAGDGAPISFGTEAGVFAAAGIPAVICGPGSIEDAHRPDESVEIAQLERCEELLATLLTTLVA